MKGISSSVGLLLAACCDLILLRMISGASSGDSGCVISSPYESRYVRAFLESGVPTLQSCFSNSTTAASQEIHVVNLRQVAKPKDTNPKEVYVTVKSHQSRGKYRLPLVVVLKSDVPTTWRVETVKIRDASPIRHLFVISNHSTILFHNFGLRQSVLNRDDIPSDSRDLANWVEERYGQLTAFAELSGVNALVVEVGIHRVLGMPASCELEGRTPSVAFIRGTSRESRPITGCASQGPSSVPRHKSVHIIEVSGGVGGHTPEIIVEIVPEILGSVRSELVLLLKSPPDLSWKVKSRKVHGSIEVVGNSRVDTEAVRMDTVETRVESLPFSGKELVSWVESRYNPILSYSGVPNTNHIILTIPKQDEPKGIEPRKDVPPYLSQTKGSRLSPFKNPSRTELAVRHAVTTECHARGVEIYLPKNVAQRYGIHEDYLSLRSPSCRAHSNATHYILTSTLYGCHMQITERRGEIVYSNALVIKVERRPVVTDIIDVGSGAGSDSDDDAEYSGSGAGGDDSEQTLIDDEDYHVQTLEIGVQCKQIPERKQYPGYRQKLTYFLDAFSDREYSSVADYPVMVTHGQTVYMQASLVAEPGLGLLLQECRLKSVTGGLHLLHIVKQGCLVQSESHWQSRGSGNDVLSSGSTARFSFTVPLDLPAPRFTISCVATPCRKTSLRSNFKLTQCMEQSKFCSLQQSVVAPPSDLSLMSTIHSTGVFQLRMPSPFPTNINERLPQGERPKPEIARGPENGKAPEGKIVMEGLDSGTVIGIAFAAFVIGVMLTAALWYIHAHTGPMKQSGATRGWAESSGETTPCSTAPIHVST